MNTATLPAVGTTPDTRSLLGAGLVAGPLFAVVATAQILTRNGFDLTRHPISSLTLGEHGWVQIANFVVGGLLVLAMARGVHLTLAPGAAARWAVRLIGVFGFGLIAAGIFVPDPEQAFPLGTPAGPAAVVSWHAIAHGIAAALAFNGLIAAMIALTVRLARTGRRGLAVANLLPAVAILALSAAPTEPGASVRIALSSVVAFGWVAVVAAILRRRAT